MSEAIPLLIAFGCLALVVYLGSRLLKSRFWKGRQLRKASMMAARGRITEMTGYLTANMDKSRVSCPLTNALIYFHIRSGNLDSAEKIVLDAIGKGDKSGGAVAQLAYIAQGRNDWENAESLYGKAIDLEPSLSPTLRMNIAGLLIQQNIRLDEAEAILTEALESCGGPSKSAVHLNLAMLNSGKGNHSRAKVHALTAFELMPDNQLTQLGRAQALGLAAGASRRMNDREESSRLASKALKVLDDLPGTDKLKAELRELAGG